METVSRTIKDKDGRRKLVQIVKRDKDGRITHYEIPNYTLRKEFETASERRFHRVLINIISKINKEYKIENNNEKFIQISSQVAINRIIDINNKRNQDLKKEILDKSIDYVLYDQNNGEIKLCIELNGADHNKKNRIDRDNLVEKMFKGLVPLKTVKIQKEYNEENLYKDIKKILEESL